MIFLIVQDFHLFFFSFKIFVDFLEPSRKIKKITKKRIRKKKHKKIPEYIRKSEKCKNSPIFLEFFVKFKKISEFSGK